MTCTYAIFCPQRMETTTLLGTIFRTQWTVDNLAISPVMAVNAAVTGETAKLDRGEDLASGEEVQLLQAPSTRTSRRETRERSVLEIPSQQLLTYYQITLNKGVSFFANNKKQITMNNSN